MGYNTIAFLINDVIDSLNKSPKTAIWALTHPLMGEHQREHWLEEIDFHAKEFGEPFLHPQALEILPTFHADNTLYLRAGQNCIEELKFIKFGKTKDGKKTVTLELPNWA